MSEQKYEVVGLTRAEAVRIAEQIGQGAVLWDRGHTYPDDGVIIRPMGCKCPQCSAQETCEQCSGTKRTADGLNCTEHFDERKARATWCPHGVSALNHCNTCD
jgi:hypothetical protein